jgi:hypothetical protein
MESYFDGNSLPDLSSEMDDETLDDIVSNLDILPEERTENVPDRSQLQSTVHDLEALAHREGVSEKPREIIMSTIEDTIKDIVRAVAIGDPIRLNMVVRNLSGNKG